MVRRRVLAAVMALSAVLLVGQTAVALAHHKPDHHQGPPTQQSEHSGKKRHAIHGTVKSDVAINVGASGQQTFTVLTKQGEVKVIVEAQTRFHIQGKPPQQTPSSIHLAEDTRVVVQGEFTNSNSSPPEFTARRVMVLRTLNATGTIQSFDPSTKKLTIKPKKGPELTFIVTADTEVRPEGETLGPEDVNKKATVIGRRDPNTGQIQARVVVIRNDGGS